MPEHALGIEADGKEVNGIRGNGGKTGSVAAVKIGSTKEFSASNLRRLTMGDAGLIFSCNTGGALVLETPKEAPLSWDSASSYSATLGTCPCPWVSGPLPLVHL
jgi:hypothetical protein